MTKKECETKLKALLSNKTKTEKEKLKNDLEEVNKEADKLDTGWKNFFDGVKKHLFAWTLDAKIKCVIEDIAENYEQLNSTIKTKVDSLLTPFLTTAQSTIADKSATTQTVAPTQSTPTQTQKEDLWTETKKVRKAL